jgi:hypothetical protein
MFGGSGVHGRGLHLDGGLVGILHIEIVGILKKKKKKRKKKEKKKNLAMGTSRVVGTHGIIIRSIGIGRGHLLG